VRKYPILRQSELTASKVARSAPNTSMESGAAIVQRRCAALSINCRMAYSMRARPVAGACCFMTRSIGPPVAVGLFFRGRFLGSMAYLNVFGLPQIERIEP
jgi:hypothetical protein